MKPNILYNSDPFSETDGIARFVILCKNLLRWNTIIIMFYPGFGVAYSTFSQAHKVCNNDINANFVFSFIWSFLHYLYHMILVNMKLDVRW